YRSRDRGLTWEAISNLPSPGEWRALAVPPLHPDTLFALNQDGRLWFYREPAGAPAQIPSQPPG
ncbi:MAG: hypothetical protein IT305_03770, partial [Chloroflexi bacterium]|nr:hypothetical protein [Chloroflexota bacterium]